MNRHRTGQWLPANHTILTEWVRRIVSRSQADQDKPIHPVLQRFKDFVYHDAAIKILATDMFTEIPMRPPYDKDSMKIKPQVRNLDEMLRCVDIILSEGPQWYTSDDKDAMTMIGFPICALLTWPMATKSGYQFFRDPRVNGHWKAVLNAWKNYLSSPASLSVLDSVTGWTSADAIRILTNEGNDGVDHFTFSELYQCDPTAPYYGFTSWDNFFTRRFHDAVRPIAYPDSDVQSSQFGVDPTTVIVNACESTPCSRKEKVKLHDTFWLKHQPYSLAEMLNGADKAMPFVGGQVYQAYLSALSYHRWHAPVSGRVISIENVPGTYYSENYYQGFANIDNGEPTPDPNGPNNSQRYIAEVATRGVMMIAADNPDIGLMAAVFIGMCEVSSCEFCVKHGDHITKGQLIGTFRFGGSSHCLVFRPQTNLRFDDPGPYEDEENNKKVNSLLAVVTPGRARL